jgi:insulin-like growth factor 1 receptor
VTTYPNATSPDLWANATEAELADREYDFVEWAVSERELQISGLQPFTVYRIDVHACNQQVKRCSAAEFVFSRTKPAGSYCSLVSLSLYSRALVETKH